MTDSSYAVTETRRGPPMSVSDSNREYSNCKGIMLCNRPAISVIQGKLRSSGNSDAGAFTCGVIAQSVGMNSISLNRSKCLIIRPRNNGILTKHKKWLADLQKRKDESALQTLSDVAQKKELHDKFSEQESKLRKLAKALDSDDMDLELDIIKTNALTNTDKRNNNADVRAESKSASTPYSSSKHSDTKTATASTYNCSRPAWSLTEDAAVAELEEKEVDDEDALLSFAEDLDFDRCMGDMEVQDVMERLSQRISAMEREAELEMQRDEELQRRAEKRKEVLPVINGCVEDRNEDMVNSSIRFLNEDEKSTHADMSSLQQTQTSYVDSMIKKSKIHDKEDSLRTPKILNQPIVIVHADDDGARLLKHLAVGNLPFLYRNPGV